MIKPSEKNRQMLSSTVMGANKMVPLMAPGLWPFWMDVLKHINTMRINRMEVQTGRSLCSGWVIEIPRLQFQCFGVAILIYHLGDQGRKPTITLTAKYITHPWQKGRGYFCHNNYIQSWINEWYRFLLRQYCLMKMYPWPMGINLQELIVQVGFFSPVHRNQRLDPSLNELSLVIWVWISEW